MRCILPRCVEDFKTKNKGYPASRKPFVNIRSFTEYFDIGGLRLAVFVQLIKIGVIV